MQRFSLPPQVPLNPVCLAPENHEEKSRLIETLAQKYDYDPWRVRIFDIQRATAHLPHPPQEWLPPDLQQRYHVPTLVLQANGFTFTTAEPSLATGPHQITSPYRLQLHSQASQQTCTTSPFISLFYNGQRIEEFAQLRLVEIMGTPTLAYFPFKDRKSGQNLHTYLVINPYENCAFRCKFCSRIPHFATTPHEHSPNLQTILQTLQRELRDPGELQFINIITGSKATAEEDIALYREVIDAFAQAGYSHCRFGVYTSHLHTQKQMKTLRDMGVVFLTFTLETTTKEAAHALYSPRNPKRAFDFSAFLDAIQRAERIFSYVSSTLMLGYESTAQMKENLLQLRAQTGITLNHYIPRIWLASQARLLHPEALQLEYYVDLFAFIEREINAGRTPVGAFFEREFDIPRFQLRFRS